MPVERNDVHSQLNATRLAAVVRPGSLDELRQAVVDARAAGRKVSIAGGCHAMGGQQFAVDSVNIDTTALTRVLRADPQRGLLTIESGADWPRVIEATHAMAGAWGIRQKQTGVDAVTLAGSIAANAHGRGLLMQPLGDDVEELTLVDARGDVRVCSRTQNAELFSLAVGGYGLFGVVHAATLRLAPRIRVRRMVDIIDLDDAMNAVYRRVEQGCLYGDFQFVIDAAEDSFLQRGVFACYRPAEEGDPQPGAAADIAPDAWLELLKLAHEDKKTAFKLYAQHYLGTDGNTYWADTMQLSTYLPRYAEYLQSTRAPAAAAVKETLVIGEHYVPRHAIGAFMARARDILRTHGSEVIYGTIRAILRDTTSFLPWAKDDFACVIFNIRTPHTPQGLARTASTFRALIDASIALRGSFFLTYHRYATAAQVAACYPRFGEFLARKKAWDPDELFRSDWYVHYRDLFAAVR